MATSNYTTRCMEFAAFFKGMPGVTTFQSEDVNYNDFSGTVYIDGQEFVCIDQVEESRFMVYINNPYDDDLQWIFGYYRTFRGALNKAKKITERREYPKPVETW